MGMGVPLPLLTVLEALFLPLGCLSSLEGFFIMSSCILFSLVWFPFLEMCSFLKRKLSGRESGAKGTWGQLGGVREGKLWLGVFYE